MKPTTLALLVAFISQFLTISNGISTSQCFLQQISSQNKYLTKEEHWFNQTLDHFSPYDHRKFGQRGTMSFLTISEFLMVRYFLKFVENLHAAGYRTITSVF